MTPSTFAQIRSRLAAARAEADRVLGGAAEQALARSEVTPAGETREEAEQRLRRIIELRGEIDLHSQRIESAFVEMIETMAAVSMELVRVARDADFSPPPFPADLSRTIEVKLIETRELTVRVGAQRRRSRPRTIEAEVQSG